MINPKELRIGNFISDDDGVLAKIIGFNPFPPSVRCDEEEGCILLVDCYHANGAMRSGCETDSPECDPIPLTPEWVEKFGFVKDRGGWYLPGTEFSLTDNLFPCWLDRMLWPGGLPNFHHVALQYAHQLQNIFYSLTGEELKIETKP